MDVRILIDSMWMILFLRFGRFVDWQDTRQLKHLLLEYVHWKRICPGPFIYGGGALAFGVAGLALGVGARLVELDEVLEFAMRSLWRARRFST